MVDLTSGVPGSGKTYRLVDKVYKLITSKEKKYKHIFTNINGLDYKKCNELANDTDYVRPFEFIDLKKDIDLEYSFHQSAKNISSMVQPISLKFDYVSDENLKFYTEEQRKKYESEKEYHETQKALQDKKLIEEKAIRENYDDYVKSKGAYSLYMDSLIIIDECHLYFEDRADDKLIRFLSYHRHFNIDIDLITQNKNLINKKYLSFIETMYMAYPASKRFFSKSFRYKKYASYQEYHANIMGNESLKLSEHVFSLYSSGSNVLSKSILSKLFLPIIILSFATFVAFFLLTDSMQEDKPVVNKRLDSNTSISNQPQNKRVHYEEDEVQSKKTLESSYFVVDCFTTTCTFKQVDMTFTKKSMFEIIDKFKCTVLVNNVTDVNYYTYILECDKKLVQVLRLFNKKQFGVKNEKNKPASSTSNLFSR
jgi:zona occludens toxin